MNKLLITLFLLQATTSFGQVFQNNPYKDLIGVSIPDSLLFSEIKFFACYDLFINKNYDLDSTGVFTMFYSDCVHVRSDTGAWKISRKNTLLFSSPKEKCSFDVVILGEYYFFIRSDERERFITRVKETQAMVAKAQSIEMKGNMNGMTFLTGEILHEEFFVADYKR